MRTDNAKSIAERLKLAATIDEVAAILERAAEVDDLSEGVEGLMRHEAARYVLVEGRDALLGMSDEAGVAERERRMAQREREAVREVERIGWAAGALAQVGVYAFVEGHQDQFAPKYHQIAGDLDLGRDALTPGEASVVDPQSGQTLRDILSGTIDACARGCAPDFAQGTFEWAQGIFREIASCHVGNARRRAVAQDVDALAGSDDRLPGVFASLVEKAAPPKGWGPGRAADFLELYGLPQTFVADRRAEETPVP